MKKILLLAVLLSGCVQYEQPPAEISKANESQVVEEVKVLPPQSESIPLTPFPENITNQNNNQVLIINDGSTENIVQKNTTDPVNTAPVGSFNNPVKFDDSKVYNPNEKKNKQSENIEVIPGLEINKPSNIQ